MSVLSRMTSAGRAVRPAFVGLGVVAAAGCYAYVPPSTGVSLAGRNAQLSLSDSGAVVLGGIIGPAADAIAGRIVDDENGAYVVALTNVHHRDGDDVHWRGERVVVARSLVTGAGERRFSPSRTALFAGLTAAALVVAREALSGRGSGFGGSGVGQTGGGLK